MSGLRTHGKAIAEQSTPLGSLMWSSVTLWVILPGAWDPALSGAIHLSSALDPGEPLSSDLVATEAHSSSISFLPLSLPLSSLINLKPPSGLSPPSQSINVMRSSHQPSVVLLCPLGPL